MENIVFFNSLQDARAFQNDLVIKQKIEGPAQVLTKKEIKAEKEKGEMDTREFFINLKDDFLSKDKKAPTRVKLIKRLKKFIDNTYKNSGMTF